MAKGEQHGETATANEDSLWQEQSHEALSDALNRIETALSAYAATLIEPAKDDPASVDTTLSITPAEDKCTVGALPTLTEAFGLTDWERDTLILCAGVELSASFATLCSQINGDPRAAYATFGIALAALPGAHWDALRPNAPLRAWHLVNIAGLSDLGEGAGASLTRSPLRADERIIHYLTGVRDNSSETMRGGGILGLLTPLRLRMPPTESQREIGNQVSMLLTPNPTRNATELPMPLLFGTDEDGREAVAAYTAERLCLPLYRLDAVEVAQWGNEIETRLTLLRREARLHPFVLLLDMGEMGGDNLATRLSAVRRLVEPMDIPLILSLAGEERFAVRRRTSVPLEVARPTVAEQYALWNNILGHDQVSAETRDFVSMRLASQFSLSAAQIQVATLDTDIVTTNENENKNVNPPEDISSGGTESDPTLNRLWNACRRQARPRLDDLAVRIEATVGWDDLILPEMQKSLIRDLLAHVRHRQTVHEDWGWARRGGRGLGLSALFAGTSGTGKTLAAEVIAGILHLDLYRVDLSQTISKYIGETEKNLGRIFDSAEVGSVILLFDEADALFGKRSDVQDSHDRYANIEVSYLLQRMEQYRGLAILTTNLKNSLDTAFLRRLRFVVNFPFPDAVQREAIWKRAFPPETPTEGLNWRRLAQWSVAGGNIKSAALNATFLAADAGESVQMHHILRSAQIECAKLDRTLIEAEVAGWVSDRAS